MDTAKLEEYVRDNRRSLVGFVGRKLSDAAHRDGEDIVQDVLLGILQGPAITEPIISISAYVFRALRNRIIDEYRKPRKVVRSMDEPVEEELSLRDVIPDLKYEPGRLYGLESLRLEVRAAIGSLPEKQMEAIVETEFNGLSIRELAERTGISPGTLLARKHRGLRAIQDRLREIKEEYHGTC